MGRPLGSKNKKSKLVAKSCLRCSKSFSTYPSKATRARYCSKACTSNQFTYQCKQCHNQFSSKKPEVSSPKRFCSRICASRYYFKGACNPRWQGGITTPEHKAKKNQEWKKRNPERVRLLNAVYAHRRRSAGILTVEEWLLIKEQYGNKCLCCKASEPNVKLTIDHIIPVSKGGTNTADNIQPLCSHCNSVKHARIEDYRLTDMTV